jgi:hypothetical protein
MKRGAFIYLGLLLALAAGYAGLRAERAALRTRLDALQTENTQLAGAPRTAKAPVRTQGQVKDKVVSEDESVAAIQAALALAPGRARDTALTAAPWGGLKPGDALDVLKYFSSRAARLRAMAAIYSNWASQDPAAAMAASSQMGDSLERFYAQQAIVRAWGAKDPGAALAWVQAQPDSMFRAQALQQIGERWAQQDLPGALAWLAQAPAGAARDDMLRAVGATWAVLNPTAALDYFFKLPGGQLVNDQIASTISTYAKTDAGAAAAYVTRIPDAHAQDTAAKAVGQVWAATDAAAAQAWAKSLPAGDTADNALAGVAGGWAKTDPAAAIAWVQSLPLGAMHDDAAYEIVAVWQYNAQVPEQMAALATTMAEGTARQVTYKVVAEKWGSKDPDAVLQWVQVMQAGGSLDYAMWGLGIGISLNAPFTAEQYAQAAELVPEMKSTSLRRDVIVYISRGWLKADRGAAAAWLNQTTLADADKAALLKTADVAK